MSWANIPTSIATLAPVPGPGNTETTPELNSIDAPYQSLQTAFSTAKTAPAATPATGTFLASPLPKNFGSTFFSTFLIASFSIFLAFFLNCFSNTSVTFSETQSMMELTQEAISASLNPEAVAMTLESFQLCLAVIPLKQFPAICPTLPPLETAPKAHSAESRPMVPTPLAALKPASVTLPATFAALLTEFLASFPATTPTAYPTAFPEYSTVLPATLATPFPTVLTALFTALKGFHIFSFLNITEQVLLDNLKAHFKKYSKQRNVTYINNIIQKQESIYSLELQRFPNICGQSCA